MNNRVLTGLDPEKVFYWFEEICKIPHGSYNEKALSDYIISFAKERGITMTQDESWNLIGDVPATKGYENAPKVILQAHIDMVCNKEDGFEFNFAEDPITPVVENGWIHADRTTLGADNGIAVAEIMAIMDSEDIPHPPLQVMFTVIEEVAGTGASRMDYRWPDGEYLINNDVFYDDALLISCGGISKNVIDFPLERTPILVPESKVFFDLDITGLTGGHSGEYIHEGRGNAIDVLGEILYAIGKHFDFELTKVDADGLFNTICGAAHASICVKKADQEAFQEYFQILGKDIRTAYNRTDPDMTLELTMRAMSDGETSYKQDLQNRLVRMIFLSPTGMDKPFDTPCTVADNSSNLGSLKEEDGQIRLVMSIRNNSAYRHEQLLDEYRVLCDICGASIRTESSNGSWEYNPDSPFRDKACHVYESLFGAPPALKAVHSGIETAIIINKMAKQGRKLDAIAFGYIVTGAHSPEEKVNIASVAKCFTFLKALLASMK